MGRALLPSATTALLLMGLQAPAVPAGSTGTALAPADRFAISLAAFDAGTNLKAAGQVSATYALHAAVIHDRPEAARRLIEGGVPVDMRNDGGLTPLMVAASFGNVMVAETLIDLGADLGARNPAGHTALHIAALAGQADVARLLIAHGADRNARLERNGETPLHFAALLGRLKVIDLLLAQGVDVNIRDNQGVTPLQYARRRLQANAVNRLIAHGAQIDHLADAVNADDVARAIELIAAGEDVNGHDLFGTPLHWAAAKGRLAIAVILIDRGADLEASGEPEEARPLHTAALNGQAEMAAFLIARGARVDARDAAGRTALMIAGSFAQPDVARILLAAGADPNAEDATWGNRPIHYAACSGDMETVRLLVARGVNVNIRNRSNGATALHYAANKGALPMVDLLLAGGAEMNSPDKAGWTPLKLASNHRHQDVIDRLEHLGALLRAH
ncbi:MAG: ankyrin repeat domain-containing protein [Parvibaculaceae bacterium]